jgi:hypothetical protein
MMSINYYFSKINQRISTLSEAFVLLIIIGVTLLFHFPSRFDIGNEQYALQKHKSNHLFENAFANHDRISHTAALESRILIPGMIRVFNLNKLSLIILSLTSGILLLGACFIYLLEKADITTAFWLTMAFAFTYTGVTGFVTSVFIFDALSLSLVFIGFLVLKKTRGMWNWTFGVSIYFFAILNDERSFFTVLGFLVLTKISDRDYFNRIFTSTILAFLFYGLYRLLLKYYFRVNTPVDGVSMSLLIDQLNNFRMALLMFGEGLWILVMIWFFSSNKGSKWNIIYVVLYIFSVFLSFTVIDIGRSTIYWFPILFIGLTPLLEMEIIKRRNYTYSIFLICLFIPTYYVSGNKTVWSVFSIFEQATRFITGKY